MGHFGPTNSTRSNPFIDFRRHTSALSENWALRWRDMFGRHLRCREIPVCRVFDGRFDLNIPFLKPSQSWADLLLNLQIQLIFHSSKIPKTIYDVSFITGMHTFPCPGWFKLDQVMTCHLQFSTNHSVPLHSPTVSAATQIHTQINSCTHSSEFVLFSWFPSCWSELAPVGWAGWQFLFTSSSSSAAIAYAAKRLVNDYFNHDPFNDSALFSFVPDPFGRFHSCDLLPFRVNADKCVPRVLPYSFLQRPIIRLECLIGADWFWMKTDRRQSVPSSSSELKFLVRIGPKHHEPISHRRRLPMEAFTWIDVGQRYHMRWGLSSVFSLRSLNEDWFDGLKFLELRESWFPSHSNTWFYATTILNQQSQIYSHGWGQSLVLRVQEWFMNAVCHELSETVSKRGFGQSTRKHSPRFVPWSLWRWLGRGNILEYFTITAVMFQLNIIIFHRLCQLIFQLENLQNIWEYSWWVTKHWEENFLKISWTQHIILQYWYQHE